MSTISHGWKQHATRWWTLTIPRIAKGWSLTLDDLSEVPGVQSVHVRKHDAMWFYDVTIAMHESTFESEPFRRLQDAFELRAPGRGLQLSPCPALPVTLRTLRPYQLSGVDWLVANGGGVLGDEMGVGKTSTAMVAAEALRSALHTNAPILIIGPKFTRDVWRRELQAVFGPETELFACEGRKPTPEQERAMSRTKWWFVHYQILDGWRPALTRPMHAHRPAVTILDEAHWLKNPLSKRTKAAMATALLATCRIVLTGTPIDNAVNDLWPLLTLASGAGSWGTYFSFAHRYTHHEKGTYGWSSVGTRRMPELHGRMEHVYLRRTVAQIGGEIPPLTREQFIVEPSGTMPRELKKWCGGQPELALDRIRDALAGGHLGGDTLAAITAWRKWTSETKMPSTVHLAASLLGEGEKVVIFTWQKATAEMIAQSIRDCVEREDAKVWTVHGDIDQKERDATVAWFQESTSPMAIVATIDSLKEGVTLHAARREIIHDLHWVPSTILQAEARISRLGQTRPCLSTWMIVENSVDAVIAKHLMAKAEVISEALLDTRAENAFVEVGLKTSDASGSEFAQRILEGL